MKRTFQECLQMFPQLTLADAWPHAIIVRGGFECLTVDEIEDRIARWEALEEACVQGGPQMVEVMRALRAGAAAQAQAQNLQSVINAELAAAASYSGCCKCNSPAVPTSLEDWPLRGDRWCRKCAHEYCRAAVAGKMYSDYVYDDKYEEPAAPECGCGGPAGHVPNGLLCRKGLR